MEDWQRNILPQILIPIATAISGSIGGGISVHQFYADRLEAKTNESNLRLTMLQNQEIQNEELTKKYNIVQLSFEELNAKHESLLADYKKATTTDGLTYEGPSANDNWQQIELNTGDKIRFKLTSYSLYTQIVRITEEGPIVRAIGCQPYVIDYSFTSERDGPYAYLLKKGEELFMQVASSGTQAGYSFSNPQDLENIWLICEDYDLKGQKALIRFRKNFTER